MKTMLTQFLSRFSTITVQRSASYVKDIDLHRLNFRFENNKLSIKAQIEGTDLYETYITIHTLKNIELKLLHVCSCISQDNYTWYLQCYFLMYE